MIALKVRVRCRPRFGRPRSGTETAVWNQGLRPRSDKSMTEPPKGKVNLFVDLLSPVLCQSDPCETFFTADLDQTFGESELHVVLEVLHVGAVVYFDLVWCSSEKSESERERERERGRERERKREGVQRSGLRRMSSLPTLLLFGCGSPSNLNFSSTSTSRSK
jgi:hypothetical protein